MFLFDENNEETFFVFLTAEKNSKRKFALSLFLKRQQ